MSHSFCSDDFSLQPYWWDLTPVSEAADVELPASTDVLVIGSGYTGLHCALETARAGRHTTVIDSQELGWGCSSRNGGQISGEIKPDYDELKGRYGDAEARALIGEARTALDWLGDFVDQQGIDCDYRRCGRFVAAHSPRQFEKLVRQVDNQVPGLEQDLSIAEKSDQASEIDSDYYHGGMVVARHCSLDPAKYHAGLADLVRASGADEAVLLDLRGEGCGVGRGGRCVRRAHAVDKRCCARSGGSRHTALYALCAATAAA